MMKMRFLIVMIMTFSFITIIFCVMNTYIDSRTSKSSEMNQNIDYNMYSPKNPKSQYDIKDSDSIDDTDFHKNSKSLYDLTVPQFSNKVFDDNINYEDYQFVPLDDVVVNSYSYSILP